MSDGEDANRRTRLHKAITLFDEGAVSLGAAAKMAGVSRSEFLDDLGQAGISAIQYTAEDVFAEEITE